MSFIEYLESKNSTPADQFKYYISTSRFEQMELNLVSIAGMRLQACRNVSGTGIIQSLKLIRIWESGQVSVK